MNNAFKKYKENQKKLKENYIKQESDTGNVYFSNEDLEKEFESEDIQPIIKN